MWAGGEIDLVLTLCFSISVSLSAPIAAFVTRRTEDGRLKVLIGVASSLTGFVTILKTIFS